MQECCIIYCFFFYLLLDIFDKSLLISLTVTNNNLSLSLSISLSLLKLNWFAYYEQSGFAQNGHKSYLS
jgi:hypothetical protein